MNIAASVSWDFPAIQEPLISGFRVKYGTEPGTYPDSDFVAEDQRTHTLSLDSGSKYYAVVVAIDSNGEIGPVPGSEIEIDLISSAPTNFRLTES